MRNAFAQTIINEFSGRSDCFFLTGDLGFMALEEVRAAMGERFVNCGVAEQNMIGVAAGLAREGMRVFAYSIAPFCYARPFEQIRNDLAFGKLPVCLIGNGGGYGYGHMGPTHHALEDCAAMNALNVHCLIPAFDADIAPQLTARRDGPVYLRLGYETKPKDAAIPPYAPWRCVLTGESGIMAALGPLAGLAWNTLLEIPAEKRPAVWAVTELPLAPLPKAFCAAIEAGKPLFIIEEHVRQGGLAMQLLYALSMAGLYPTSVVHRHALGYPSGRYGSQAFHRRECGLDAEFLKNLVFQSTRQ